MLTMLWLSLTKGASRFAVFLLFSLLAIASGCSTTGNTESDDEPYYSESLNSLWATLFPNTSQENLVEISKILNTKSFNDLTAAEESKLLSIVYGRDLEVMRSMIYGDNSNQSTATSNSLLSGQSVNSNQKISEPSQTISRVAPTSSPYNSELQRFRKIAADYQNSSDENEEKSVNAVAVRYARSLSEQQLEGLQQTLPANDWLTRGWVDLAYLEKTGNLNSWRTTYGYSHPAHSTFREYILPPARIYHEPHRPKHSCPLPYNGNDFLGFNGSNWCDANGLVYPRGVVASSFNPYVLGSRIIILLNTDAGSAENVYNYLVGELNQRNYIVPDRRSNNTLLNEIRTQYSRATETEIARLGQLFNSRLVLQVSIQPNSVNPGYRDASVRLTDIETSQVYYTNQVVGSQMQSTGILWVLLKELPGA